MRRILTLAVAVATLMTVTSGMASAAPDEKVSVCHKTAAGNGYQLVSISANALDRHLEHGDGAPSSPLPDTPSQGFDAACAIVAIATGPAKVAEGDFVNGSLHIGLTVYESAAGEFSGTGTYSFGSSYALATEILDACIDPSNSRALGLGVVLTGSSHFVGQYTVITMEDRAGAIYAHSKLQPTLSAAALYLAERCSTGAGPIAGPGVGFLTFW